jgi:hypothetical protein
MDRKKAQFDLQDGKHPAVRFNTQLLRLRQRPPAAERMHAMRERDGGALHRVSTALLGNKG